MKVRNRLFVTTHTHIVAPPSGYPCITSHAQVILFRLRKICEARSHILRECGVPMQRAIRATFLLRTAKNYKMNPSIGVMRPLAIASLCITLTACGGGPPKFPERFTVGGTVTGTPAASLILLDNGGDPLTINGTGSFTFAMPVNNTAPYSITVGTQPAWQTCVVTDGTGKIQDGPQSDVSVDCSTLTPATAVTLATTAQLTTARPGGGTGVELSGVTADASGNVFAVESSVGNVYEINSSGTVTALGSTTGNASAAAWSATNSTLYVGDPLDGTVVKFVGTSGAFSAGTPAINGLTNPTGVAVDNSGNIYVAQGGASGGATSSINEYSSSGALISTIATGSASFTPYGVAVDGNGNIYASDKTHNEVVKIVSGTPMVLAGSAAVAISGTTEGVDGVGAAATFNAPTSVSVDSLGNLYVLDSGSGDIRQVSPVGSVVALTNVNNPTALAAGPNQKIYFVTSDGAGTGDVQSIVPTGT